jgi:hypothetical protein
LSLVLPHLLATHSAINAAIQDSGFRVQSELTRTELMLAPQVSKTVEVAATPPDQFDRLTDRINLSQAEGSAPLKIGSLELYLIRAFSTVDLGQGPTLAVAYEPEFLFVADVGLPALAGVSVWWKHGLGLGDPSFPDMSNSKLRSIDGRDAHQLLYPAVAGELLIGFDSTTPVGELVHALETEGLWNVHVTGSLAEARCAPFREADACHALEAKSFIRYAEQNRIVRQGELNPGWNVIRLI